MHKITVVMELDDLDVVNGWGFNSDELAESIRARLSEVYGDDGQAYVPNVVSVEID